MEQYLAIFTYVFEALNLKICIAEIQLPGNDNLAPAAVHDIKFKNSGMVNLCDFYLIL
jgi:hypothetical protein